MINHLNLVYFITAAKELNFTRAAQKLYISQQALSNHIVSLEKEVGVSLIDRKSPMKLTYAGEIFYRYAVQMEDLYRALMQELGDVREDKRGQMTVGISHTRGRLILPKVLPSFMKKYPLIEVHVLEGNTKELTRALLEGTVDIAVGPYPRANPEIAYTKLLTERVVLAVSEELFGRYGKEESDRLRAELSETGKIACLRKVPFLLNKRGNISREIADAIFQEEGLKPHTLIETENIETLGEMCASGIGVAFYPTSLLQTLMMDEGLGQLQIFELNYPCTRMEISAACRKNRYLTEAMKEMIRIMQEVIT